MTTRRRSALALTLGSVGSGVLAYVFFATVTRALGPEAAAPVSVLWALWSFTAAALTFPVQHWVARSVEVNGGERSVRVALPRVSVLVVAAALVTVAVCWFFDGELFGRAGPAFPLLAGGLVVLSAILGLTRGLLTARGRLGAVGLGLVLENGLRFLLAGVLALAGVQEPVVYGVALLFGYTSVLFFASALRPGRTGQVATESSLAFLGGASGGQFTGQAVLTGGPVLLALAGDDPAHVTVLFAALALFRAPYTLAIGLVAPLTSAVTRLVLAERHRELTRIRLALLISTGVATIFGAVVGWFVGPWLLPLVFGPEIRLGAAPCAVIAAGSVVAMGNLVATVLMMARNRTHALATSWLLALLPGALWFWLGTGSPLLRTCVTFLLVEACAFGLLLVREAGFSAGRGLTTPAPGPDQHR